MELKFTPVSSFILLLLSVCVAGTPARAAKDPAATPGREVTGLIQVGTVRFNQRVGAFRWSNVEIELTALENRLPNANSPKYLDNVKVTVTLAWNKPEALRTAESRFWVYKSTATIVTLESTQKRTIAFWLPYDIVERDSLTKDPDYWLIELEVDGNPVKGEKNHLSNSIPNVSSFKQVTEKESEKNQGILLPTYLSPYEFNAVDRNPPAYIRLENPKE